MYVYSQLLGVWSLSKRKQKDGRGLAPMEQTSSPEISLFVLPFLGFWLVF